MKMNWRIAPIAVAVLGLSVAACDGDGTSDGASGDQVVQDEQVGPIGASFYENGVKTTAVDCNIDGFGGTGMGDIAKDFNLVDCYGNPINYGEVMCGAPAGWTYYFFGKG